MKKYIGTKTLNAEPMTKGEAYNHSLLRGRITTAEREIPGYHVVYSDGYESWSPKDVFDAAYNVADTLLDRLNIEYKELDKKAGSIVEFRQTEAYKNLRDTDRAMLDVQFDTMIAYLGILGCRSTSVETGQGGFCGLDFGTAIHLLERGYVIRRSGWNGKDIVVFKQVPSSIESDIIPNMQSLPLKAKELIMAGNKRIDYTSQCLIYNTKTGRADSWVPSISDVFAHDWELVAD